MPSGQRPTLIMFDCCPKEEAGFQRSVWRGRGTEMCWCYFHFMRAWTDACAVKMQGQGELARERMKIIWDLDAIVWAKVRKQPRRGSKPARQQTAPKRRDRCGARWFRPLSLFSLTQSHYFPAADGEGCPVDVPRVEEEVGCG